MKLFKLKSIEYKNIMSVGDDAIKIQLDECHKTLITGSNGGGKSTMLEAITFALFGKPFRDIKKGQLINSVNKKNLLVILEMEYNKKSYKITRGQKPNIFKVEVNGKELDESAAVKDFQSEFEAMIGMNYVSFKQIVVLGTAGYTPFMGLSTPARRKLVEDLLEVTILADMDKINKDKIKEINSELSKIDLSISHIQNQIKTHEDYAERQKKMSGDNVERLKKMYDECISEVDKIKERNLTINEKILNLTLPEDVSSDISENTRTYTKIETEINSYKRVVDLYTRGGSCPTCKQDISIGKIDPSINDNIADLKLSLSELENSKKSLLLMKEKYDKIKTEINSLELEKSSNKSMAINAVERAKKIKLAINEANKEFIDNSDEINLLKSELSDTITKKSDLVQDKQNRSIITDMLKDSGVKGAIISKYIPLFNKQINHYLNLLEADYSFTLNEEFSETIKSRGREDFSYASFSQGEKGRIDLALMFTWRDIAEKVSGVKISCLFLDEVFDGAFDASATKSVTTILNTMVDSNIFIISHRDHNPQDYGKHIQMKKIGRFTVME